MKLYVNKHFILPFVFIPNVYIFAINTDWTVYMKKIMIYKTCAKELVIPLIAAIPEIVAVMFVDVHSTD